MPKLRARLNLDDVMKNLIEEHYRIRLEDVHLGKPCFSNPQIGVHCCNARAPLPGDMDCDVCHKDPYALCTRSCHINRFCLAVYAWRLGIGQTEMYGAIKENLTKDYDQLLEDLYTATKGTDLERRHVMPEVKSTPLADAMKPEGEATQQSSPLPDEVEADARSIATVGNQENLGEAFTETTPDDLIGMQAAAELWGCSAPNIYGKVRDGKLIAHLVDGRKFVSQADVMKLKATSSRSRRGR